MKHAINIIKYTITFSIIALVCIFGYKFILKYFNENEVLKQVIARLEADSRVAEILVTGVNFDEKTQKTYTTIKFLEYDSVGQPLDPKYFSFSGNIIQFQSLVIRFDDIHVRGGDQLKGKSAYIFWKVFLLNGENTQEYEIAKINEVPRGYKIKDLINPFEKKLWQNFWHYALDPKQANREGIKNAQIEAPGSMFIPGVIYTITIEHDGGLRIDSSPLSPILRGERILG